MSTNDRAYALLHVKSFDAERRTFAGVATTPELDRQGHSVDPAGVTFRNPLPLLLHHDQTCPIGTVTLFPATAAGIAFEATLPVIEAPGALRDRVDLAWQSIKAGLMSGVSIGFRILADGVERLKGGGLRLTKTEVVELSLVTIPANVSASIRMVKTLDVSPGVSGQPSPGVSGAFPIARAKGAPTMAPTITEQISSTEASRAAKAGRMAALMLTAAEAGTTLGPTETEEY